MDFGKESNMPDEEIEEFEKQSFHDNPKRQSFFDALSNFTDDD